MSVSKKKLDNLLKFGDFCTVQNEKLEEDGLSTGSKVFVAGTNYVFETPDDLYLHRVKLLVNKMNDIHIDTSQFFMVDPHSLRKVGPTMQKKLTKVMQEDFKSVDDNHIEEGARDEAVN